MVQSALTLPPPVAGTLNGASFLPEYKLAGKESKGEEGKLFALLDASPECRNTFSSALVNYGNCHESGLGDWRGKEKKSRRCSRWAKLQWKAPLRSAALLFAETEAEIILLRITKRIVIVHLGFPKENSPSRAISFKIITLTVVSTDT